MAKKYLNNDLSLQLLAHSQSDLASSGGSVADAEEILRIDHIDQIILCTIEMHQECESASNYYQ